MISRLSRTENIENIYESWYFSRKNKHSDRDNVEARKVSICSPCAVIFYYWGVFYTYEEKFLKLFGVIFLKNPNLKH